MAIDCCCNTNQWVVLGAIVGASLLCLLLWHTKIMAPIKLIAVFFHELSHALAALLTGGKVSSIKINQRFGGVTLTRGGNRCCTLTAGYIGSVCWGAFFLLMASTRLCRMIGCSIFVLACVLTPVTLRIEGKKMCACGSWLVLVLLIEILAAIVVVLMVFRERWEFDPLIIVLPIVGTACGLHALYDVFSDTLIHKINNDDQGKSDAVMLAEEVTGTARCWGLLWSVISLAVLTVTAFGLIIILADAATCSMKFHDQESLRLRHLRMA